MTLLKCIDGSFKNEWWWNHKGWNSYLRCWIEESAVGSLELTFANECSSFSSLNALVQFPVLLVGTETEWVDPVGAREELRLTGISLHVLPSSVGPSARDELEVFFGHSSLLLSRVIVPARAHGSASRLVASAVVQHVVTSVLLFSAVFHCCLSIYENLH